MAPTATSNRNESATARVLGAASSGVLELLGFHPVDTVTKRLMNNSSSSQSLSQVIFKDAAQKSVLQKYLSLFPGLGAAAGYKVLQRVYKFGGQPYVNDYLNSNHKKSFQTFAVGEIALLPLDALKIKMQTNAAAYEGKTILQIIKSEGWGLYRGASWTAARNAPGSFALFGGSAVVKEYVFKLEDYSQATFFHNFVASISGAFFSITLSAPLDVIKTRIQARSNAQAESGLSILKQMAFKEGFSSFFKGLTPKLLVVGPKLVFSFTIAQQMIPMLDKYIKGV